MQEHEKEARKTAIRREYEAKIKYEQRKFAEEMARRNNGEKQ